MTAITLIRPHSSNRSLTKQLAIEGRRSSCCLLKVARYEAILTYLSVNTNVMNGLKGPHVIFTGVNVHILSGAGMTNDGKAPRGLGNLIIGYNELVPGYDNLRTGYHNLVIGPRHSYNSCGGFVAGLENMLSGPYSSVSGGIYVDLGTEWGHFP